MPSTESLSHHSLRPDSIMTAPRSCSGRSRACAVRERRNHQPRQFCLQSNLQLLVCKEKKADPICARPLCKRTDKEKIPRARCDVGIKKERRREGSSWKGENGGGGKIVTVQFQLFMDLVSSPSPAKGKIDNKYGETSRATPQQLLIHKYCR